MFSFVSHYQGPLFLSLIVAMALVVRLIWLNWIPNGLNWDELAYGYNAVSLWKTGHDEWGAVWPLFLRSYGEYKPALLSYLQIPFIAWFGQTAFSLRLVTVLLGIVSLLATYGIVRRLDRRQDTALLSALLVALAPWHIHYSRAAMDPMVGFAWLMLGVWGLLTKNRWLKLLGAVSLGLSMYSYNAERVFIPLLIGGSLVGLQLWQKSKRKIISWKTWLPASAIWLLMASLLLVATLWGPAGKRAQQVLSWDNTALESQVLERYFRTSVVGWPRFRVLNNKAILFAQDTAQRYLVHFQPDFLFGDHNLSSRHAFGQYGNLLLLTLPLMVIGLLTVDYRQSSSRFWLLWLILAPIPAALSSDVPHSGRVLQMLPALAWFAAQGWVWLVAKLPLKPVLSHLVLLTFLGFNFALYWQNYFLFFPEGSSYEWQGYLESAVTDGYQTRQDFTHTIFTSVDSHPGLHFLWYNHLDPAQYHHPDIDQGLDNITFGSFSEPELACALLQPGERLVLRGGELSPLIEPQATYDLFNRFHEPEPALNVYLSDSLSPEEHQLVEQICATKKADAP